MHWCSVFTQGICLLGLRSGCKLHTVVMYDDLLGETPYNYGSLTVVVSSFLCVHTVVVAVRFT